MGPLSQTCCCLGLGVIRPRLGLLRVIYVNVKEDHITCTVMNRHRQRASQSRQRQHDSMTDDSMTDDSMTNDSMTNDVVFVDEAWHVKKAMDRSEP